MRQRNENKPRRRRHQKVRAAQLHLVVAGESDYGQREECQDRTDPADGGCDVGGERESAKSGRHHLQTCLGFQRLTLGILADSELNQG